MWCRFSTSCGMIKIVPINYDSFQLSVHPFLLLWATPLHQSQYSLHGIMVLMLNKPYGQSGDHDSKAATIWLPLLNMPHVSSLSLWWISFIMGTTKTLVLHDGATSTQIYKYYPMSIWHSMQRCIRPTCSLENISTKISICLKLKPTFIAPQ